MEIAVLGIDFGKNSCRVVGLDPPVLSSAAADAARRSSSWSHCHLAWSAWKRAAVLTILVACA